MIGKCDFYLPLTCFGYEKVKIHKNFDDLPNPKRGYGIIIKKDKQKIYDFLINTNWSDVAFQSTNGAYNLRFDLIYNHLVSNGFIDSNSKSQEFFSV
jgi:hypothetical protein